MQSFEAALEPGKGGGAFVVLPAEVVGALGGGSRFRVRGQFAGVDLRSSTMPAGDGRVCLGVHKAVRESAGVGFGDRVMISIERDDTPREISIPEELSHRLAEDEIARDAFERLSPTHRREYAEWVAGARKPETRRRRLEQAIGMLHEGIRHP